METFQDRGVWIWIRIRFVLRGWIRIRSISDRIRNPAYGCAELVYVYVNKCECMRGRGVRKKGDSFRSLTGETTIEEN